MAEFLAVDQTGRPGGGSAYLNGRFETYADAVGPTPSSACRLADASSAMRPARTPPELSPDKGSKHITQ